MKHSSPEIELIRAEIAELRTEIHDMQLALSQKQKRVLDLDIQLSAALKNNGDPATPHVNVLSNEEIARYARQLILPGVGVKGQEQLSKCAILIVGVGGLGCPAAQYLAAAGVGKLGLVDYDAVERSNFHRQILHTEQRLGLPKAESARLALQALNSHCCVETHCQLLNSENALPLVQAYDVVLDCSDNVATRYLLNDACVLAHKPLVSGSALQFDGQLTVYNYGETALCYRCLFPEPPPPETVSNCSEAGVLGAVTGIIGSLQALEAIKIVVGLGEVLAGRLLIFDGAQNAFRAIKLRGRRPNCAVCSITPTIKHLIDYEQFCGQAACDKTPAKCLLPTEQRTDVKQYQQWVLADNKHLLVDVRPPAEFDICRLPHAVNIPLLKILNDTYLTEFATLLQDAAQPIVVVCRRGNDSQIAVQHMRLKHPDCNITDLRGGLHEWHFKIDTEFPIY